MRTPNSNSPISRVRCVVNSCVHYQAGDYCMAQSIEVHPKNAKSAQETDCSTFESKV